MNSMVIVEEPKMAPANFDPHRPRGARPVNAKTLWAMLTRRWLTMLIVGALVFGGVAAFLATRPPKYSTQALVMGNIPDAQVLAPEQTLARQAADTATLESHIQLLRSEQFAAQLVDALKLVPPAGDIPQTETQLAARRAKIQEIMDSVEVRRRGVSNVIEVLATSKDPALAQNIANGLVSRYIAWESDRSIGTASRADGWLRQRLLELEADVQVKEKAAADFREHSGLRSVAGAPLLEQELSQIQQVLVTVGSQVAEREGQVAQVRAMNASNVSVETLTSVLTSETMRELRGRNADSARNLAAAEERYGPNHPSITEARKSDEEIRRQIRAESQRIAESYDIELKVSRRRMAELQAKAAAIQAKLAGQSEDSVILRQLEADAAVSRRVYETFLQRQNEITDQAMMRAPTLQLVAAAPLPISPSSFGLPVILVLAAACAAVAAVMAALARELLQDVVSNADDVETRLGTQVLTAAPLLSRGAMKAKTPESSHPAAYLLSKPMSAFAESVRVLRSKITYSAPGELVRVVAVTSALPNEGKTTMSLALARISTQSRQRVLIIDCDLRRRSLNSLLRFKKETRFLEPADCGEWNQFIIQDQHVPSLDVLPISDSLNGTDDFFGSEAMRKLMAEVREAYDLVILDCPPILSLADARTLVHLADATVVVTRADRTPVDAVRNAIAQIENAGGRVLGVALNQMNPRGAGNSSYSDPLYYGRVQKGYYMS